MIIVSQRSVIITALTSFISGVVLSFIGIGIKPAFVDSEAPLTFQYSSERARLAGLFGHTNSKDTYTYFVKTYQKFDPDEVHKLAHWVGTQLYVREGISGLGMCDNSYNWGCYHGFLAEAFAREGRSLIVKAVAACQNDKEHPMRVGGCIHGLGHGILTMRGYAYLNLLESLDMCETLSVHANQNTICNNGVFMEYNKRTMHGFDNDTWSVREFNPNDPLDPCPKLPEKYQYDCYYEQPSWWTHTMNNDFSQMGKACATVIGPENRESCFRGIGRTLPVTTNYSQGRSGEICLQFPNSPDQAHCMWDVVETLLLMNSLLKLNLTPIALCDRLSTQFQNECRERGERYACSMLKDCL